MQTYRVIIERVTRYEVEIEARDVPEAIDKAKDALDDEEGGPEAWPNSIESERIISTNTI